MKRPGSMYAPPRQPPLATLTFRVLIPKGAVADVVGASNQQNLRRMSEESGAHIQMFQAPHGAPFGVASIQGPAAVVHAATMMVLENARIVDGTVALLLPNADVPLALNLGDIPAKVSFAPKQLSRESPDTVIDMGAQNIDALSISVLLLCQALERRESMRRASQLAQPTMGENAPRAIANDNRQRSVIIPVHVVLLAKLRGPLNDIRHDTMATIVIGEPTGDEAPVSVSGVEHAVETAVRCVYEVLGERVPNVRECAEGVMRAKGKEFAGGYF